MATTIKISLVITILNEAKTLPKLLAALDKQTYKPCEIIIVDGGSTDNSAEILKQANLKNLKIFQKKGNRSVGRNLGVKKTTGNFIAFTDAGCIPQKNWLQKLVTKQKLTQKKVISGYYYGLAKNNFETAQIPYVLVMPDKAREPFLPSSRSMLIEKKYFLQLGGFDKKLINNEDYAFAKKIDLQKLAFAKSAKVAWLPRKNLKEFIVMIYRFAKGDAEAKIIRPKIFLIFLRYIFFLVLLIFNLKFFGFIFIIYFFWAITKNYRYAKKAFYYLPLLQLAADLAVMWGTLRGWLIKD